MLSYNDLCTLFYEADDKQFPDGALDYYRKLMEEAGGPVLEAMSGSGRFLIPFVQEGFDIDGVDASASMLEAAREKCAAAGLSPVMIEAKLDDVQLPRTYKLIVCVAGSISLIPDRKEFRAILANCRRHLDPGGSLVMEIPTPAGALKKSNVALGRWVDLDETRRILLTVVIEYDRKMNTSRMLNKYELFDGAKLLDTELEVIDQRFWESEDLQAELVDAGFTTVKTCKPYGNAPAAPDDPMFIVVCTA